MISLNSCHNNRVFDDSIALLKICGDILSTELEPKKNDDTFAFCFIEGRNRSICSYEDWACFKSTKLYSKYNYPIFCFLYNPTNFLHNNIDIIKDWRINIIQIPELNSLDAYSDFCIKQLYFLIPEQYNRVLTIQPDGFLIRSGWENFLLEKDFDYIGSHWQHYPRLLYKQNDKWMQIDCPLTNIGGGAFSYRKADKMRYLSKEYGNLELAEAGTPDYSKPKEDLFFGLLSRLCNFKLPTPEECCEFCRELITLEQYKNKISFGCHYPVLRPNKYTCLVHN